MSLLRGILAESQPENLALQVVVVGPPGAGKTSYLAALYGTRLGTTAELAEWTVQANGKKTWGYLRDAWDRLTGGQAVRPTDPTSELPMLSLTLRRQDTRGRLTHTVTLNCIDSAGAFAFDREARKGSGWAAISESLQKADFVILAVDAMNVVYGHQDAVDGVAQDHHGKFQEMLEDACGHELRKKALAVCFCKCDAVAVVDIDGVEDQKDARVLAQRLVPEATRKLWKSAFKEVEYFGVSVLRDHWRWNRSGTCVRVGRQPMDPVGIFEPFEWACGAVGR